MTPASRRRAAVAAAVAVAALAGVAAWSRIHPLSGMVLTSEPIDAPARLATWPWPNAARETIDAGVTHWLDRSSPDGTVLDLFEFDFRRNPRLEFLLFDQDQDDEHPFDDRAAFWERGVAAVAKRLNQEGRGAVIAATNGLFFGYTRTGPGGVASHVAPVVVRGVPHFEKEANPRWTFGVVNGVRGPVFKQEAASTAQQLRQYAYASGGAESLVRQGKIASLPPGSVNRSVAFDRMRTTRVGLGWTRDSRKLYLLFVKEPDSEGPSLIAAEQGISMAGGWSVPDLGRFFAALGVWGAINSDAGDAGQLIYRMPTGQYELVPPRWSSAAMRMSLAPDFSDAPAGGTMMYWVVRDRDTQR